MGHKRRRNTFLHLGLSPPILHMEAWVLSSKNAPENEVVAAYEFLYAFLHKELTEEEKSLIHLTNSTGERVLCKYSKLYS
jgi:hypothetical protein